MIKIKQYGDFKNTIGFLEYMLNPLYVSIIKAYGAKGVEALRAATPKESGETANSWSYEVIKKPGRVILAFNNDNVTSEGTPIAILLQYGHATRSGSYVQGIDFINPALKPVFEQMADELWRRVVLAKQY